MKNTNFKYSTCLIFPFFKPFNENYEYGINTGKNNFNSAGKIETVNGNYDNKCYEKHYCSKSYTGSTDVRLQILGNGKNFLKDKIEILVFDEPMIFTYKNSNLFRGLKLSRYELEKSEISMKNEDNKCLCERCMYFS